MRVQFQAQIASPDMEATVAKAQSQLERVALVALGWIFICLGIVGLVLPVVPGAVLIVVGALMVNLRWEWLWRMLEKCRVRFSILARVVRHFSAWSESSQSLFKKNPSDSGSVVRSVKWLTMDVRRFHPRGKR